MAEPNWNFDTSDGDLLLGTGVAGRAARMGHRLTIALTSWQATVSWADGRPAAVRLSADVDSFTVLRGEGGLTPLSGPEKALIRVNALNCLAGSRHPRIEFTCDTVESVDEAGDHHRLSGILDLHGRTHPQTVDVRVQDLGDAWRVRCDAVVRHSDHAVKPYSMLMGSMWVADEVTVSLCVDRPKEPAPR
ncbi:YceI family protein [Mycobacterium sp. M1]|uniref:YceI family protein n=1 Tax=Mycolicibacter acidiphilus TaxID=2835306 RepID=A0ABS5REM4_9MYCO|nr:YceI family protein [Mycolicibacter acidiphilus]MBS9532732.1 YceI family protein [Mycolicibacter acidiphilus]